MVTARLALQSLLALALAVCSTTTDYVPHLPDLLVSLCGAWRHIRVSQTEVDLFGRSYVALEEAGAAIESLSHHLTGQRGFPALREASLAEAGDELF